MDLKGFEAINKAFTEANVVATVIPQPEEGEHLSYVTVETDPGMQPALVLNALRKASLMHEARARESVNYLPELSPIGVQPGSITLEDENVTGGRYW